ncbi:unnamed protein product [Urochloa humidicola]
MDGKIFMDVPDEHYRKLDTEITDILIEWGMPATMCAIHPIYFAKCLTITKECRRHKLPADLETVKFTM